MENEKKVIDAGVDLYSMNKQLVRQAGKISKYKIEENVKPMVASFFRKNPGADTKYFMLLCHERRDYTVFAFPNRGTKIYAHGDWDTEATDILIDECMANRGVLYSVNYDGDAESALELWIECDDGELYCYYLFPYGMAVIEV